MGDKSINLKKAIGFLEANGMQIKKASSVYETEPIGVTEQDWFYNMVIELQTDLSPQDLLLRAKNIEQKMGRKESSIWGPRVIDIDVLMYDNLVVDTKVKEYGLKIPHPELKNRAFVVLPLLEMEPDVNLPNGEKVHDYLSDTKDQAIKKIGRLEELDGQSND